MRTIHLNSRDRLSFVLLTLYAAIVLYWMWTGYLRGDATFVAGLGVMLLAVVVRQPGAGSWRFGMLAALCVGLALVVPARTFHFMALVFSAFFVFENTKGKINEAPLLVAFLLTAVVKTMSIVLGFSLRLELSKIAATALRFLDPEAVAEGNIIRFDGKDFSVDPACMGLQMLEVSFLFYFFLLGLFERRTGRKLSLFTLVAVTVAVGFLNLIFNQLRIVFLVLFHIVPGNPMHDAAGLAGLALYVFIPVWFGLRWLYRRASSSGAVNAVASPLPVGNRWGQPAKTATQIFLTLCLFYFASTGKSPDEAHLHHETALVPAGLPAGCAAQVLADGVTKYSNDSLLVYVKPIRGWYSTEHTPLICWRGSGYEFGKVWEQKTGETILYAGTLEKKGEPLLYTAWWFDNGLAQTIDQAHWRWLDAGGAPGFSLINVTARERTILENQLKLMLKR